MSITRGKVGSGSDISDGTTFNVTWTGSTTAGSLLVLYVLYRQNQTTPTITTPTNFTKLIFHDADCYVYVWPNASSINGATGVAVTCSSGGNNVPRAGILTEYISSNGNTWTLSQDPAVVSQGTAGTALTTNAITTSGASSNRNIVCISGFAQVRANITAPVLSAPTNSYLLTTTVSGNDGTSSIVAATYDKIITADVNNESSGVTSNTSLAWTAAVIAYAEQAGDTEEEMMPSRICMPSAAQCWSYLKRWDPERWEWFRRRRERGIILGSA